MSSAEYSCKFFKPIFAYRQTVWTPIRLLLEEQSDLGPHCLQKWLLKSQADDEAGDNCCGWQFNCCLSLGISIFIFYFLGNQITSCEQLTLLLLNMTCPVLANSVDPDQLASSEANWSGFALFVIKYVNFYQKPRSSNLTGWKLEVGVAS